MSLGWFPWLPSRLKVIVKRNASHKGKASFIEKQAQTQDSEFVRAVGILEQLHILSINSI